MNWAPAVDGQESPPTRLAQRFPATAPLAEVPLDHGGHVWIRTADGNLWLPPASQLNAGSGSAMLAAGPSARGPRLRRTGSGYARKTMSSSSPSRRKRQASTQAPSSCTVMAAQPASACRYTSIHPASAPPGLAQPHARKQRRKQPKAPGQPDNEMRRPRAGAAGRWPNARAAGRAPHGAVLPWAVVSAGCAVRCRSGSRSRW